MRLNHSERKIQRMTTKSKVPNFYCSFQPRKAGWCSLSSIVLRSRFGSCFFATFQRPERNWIAPQDDFFGVSWKFCTPQIFVVGGGVFHNICPCWVVAIVLLFIYSYHCALFRPKFAESYKKSFLEGVFFQPKTLAPTKFTFWTKSTKKFETHERLEVNTQFFKTFSVFVPKFEFEFTELRWERSRPRECEQPRRKKRERKRNE